MFSLFLCRRNWEMEGGVGGGVVGDKVRRAYRDESEDGLALRRTIIVCTSKSCRLDGQCRRS